jgi:hypothetical protein
MITYPGRPPGKAIEDWAVRVVWSRVRLLSADGLLEAQRLRIAEALVRRGVWVRDYEEIIRFALKRRASFASWRLRMDIFVGSAEESCLYSTGCDE